VLSFRANGLGLIGLDPWISPSWDWWLLHECGGGSTCKFLSTFTDDKWLGRLASGREAGPAGGRSYEYVKFWLF